MVPSLAHSFVRVSDEVIKGFSSDKNALGEGVLEVESTIGSERGGDG
jgi:hypothetical protein